MAMRGMVDMARTAADKLEERAQQQWPPTLDQMPDYPPGLAISLDNDDLERVDLDASEAEIGDILLVKCMMRVTSINRQEVNGQPRERVELQIVEMGIVSDDFDGAAEGDAGKD